MRIVVPFPAGGQSDIMARVVAGRLGERLGGKTMLVENRPGANGNIATEYVARSSADGQTLLLASDGQIVISPHLYKLTVDPLKDLALVASIGTTDLVLVVHPKLPVSTLPEFIAFARQSNPPLPYASVGSGSQLHLNMERLGRLFGVEFTHVPYRGGEPAMLSLFNGETVTGLGGNALADYVRDGVVRAIATTGRARSTVFSDLPTVGDTFPGFDAQAWMALFAPAGLPAETLARLRRETSALLAESETAARIRNASSFDVLFTDVETFTTRIKAEHRRYGEIVKQVGLAVD